MLVRLPPGEPNGDVFIRIYQLILDRGVIYNLAERMGGQDSQGTKEHIPAVGDGHGGIGKELRKLPHRPLVPNIPQLCKGSRAQPGIFHIQFRQDFQEVALDVSLSPVRVEASSI